MRVFRQCQQGDWSGVVETFRTFQDLTLLDFSALAVNLSANP